jgi:hypothetical protein
MNALRPAKRSLATPTRPSGIALAASTLSKSDILDTLHHKLKTRLALFGASLRTRVIKLLKRRKLRWKVCDEATFERYFTTSSIKTFIDCQVTPILTLDVVDRACLRLVSTLRRGIQFITMRGIAQNAVL